MQLPKIVYILYVLLGFIIAAIVAFVSYDIIEHKRDRVVIRMEPFQESDMGGNRQSNLDQFKYHVKSEADKQWEIMRQRENELRESVKARLMEENKKMDSELKLTEPLS